MLQMNWFLAGALALAALPPCALAQAAAPIDEARTVTLYGNVHPLARAEFDLGAADGETRLDRMVLLLKPSARQQKAFAQAQHKPDHPQGPLGQAAACD